MSLPAPLENLRARLTAAWRERAVALKALSFALVGLINTAVDATIFFLLLAYVTSSLVVANVERMVDREHRLLCDELAHDLLGRDRRQAAAEGLCGLRRLRPRRGDAHRPSTVVIAAKFMPVWAAKGDRDPGELRGEFLDHAFRGVSARRASAADGARGLWLWGCGGVWLREFWRVARVEVRQPQLRSISTCPRVVARYCMRRDVRCGYTVAALIDELL